MHTVIILPVQSPICFIPQHPHSKRPLYFFLFLIFGHSMTYGVPGPVVTAAATPGP